MKLDHIIEAQQFEKGWMMEEFFPAVDNMKEVAISGGCHLHVGKRMVSVFYEPSTRTRMSFELAMDMLGGRVVFSTENAMEFSSAAKGEVIEDSMKVASGYFPHVIVLRSNEEGMAKRAVDFSSVPIINAGDGKGQHPTQALLDIYTIWKKLGKIDGITIAMVGDLLNGRTVRSLSYLIAKFPDIKIYFVSPDTLQMRVDIKKHLRKYGVWFAEENDIRAVADKVDVIYQTRIQKERGSTITDEEKAACAVNKEILGLMQSHSIIMHPLPRNEEITREVDADPRAVYFPQAQNGLFVRMALLDMILR